MERLVGGLGRVRFLDKKKVRAWFWEFYHIFMVIASSLVLWVSIVATVESGVRCSVFIILSLLLFYFEGRRVRVLRK